MATLAAHLNDFAITVTDADRILYREPGFALLEDEQLVTGGAAYSTARIKPRRINNRYWSDLKAAPLSDPRFRHMSAADIVSRQLEDIWRKVASPGDSLALAVPPYMSNDNLGLLLGVAMELDIDVIAMVDSAVCATRRNYQHAVPVHVDLSLHTAMMTRLMQEEQAQVERTATIDDCGVLALYDNWIQVIAEAFVQQSRFDPLHTAETEQALQNGMPDWLSMAASADTVPMRLEYRGIVHEAEIESIEWVAAASPVYQAIVSSLRALYRAEDTPAIQLSDRAARMPGFADTLRTRVGGEVFLLGPGATARGLLQRCPKDRSGSGLTLLRHLPWDQASVDVQSATSAAEGGQPTHLLFRNYAHSIGSDPLVLGAQVGDGDRWLDFQSEMPGVSRRHCTIGFESGQCVVTDFSRYGTYLNGHRIDGSAVLQTGDVIRVGTPGFELRLIAAEERHGT